MQKINEILDTLTEAVNDSTLSQLDINDTLLQIRDLKQEIYERFTVTSKPQEDDEDMLKDN